MSYSFSIRAASKDAARKAVADEFDKVVLQQPIHEHDRAQAEKQACAVIDLVPEPEDETREIAVSVSGWVQWTGTYPGDHVFSAASVSVSASIIHKPTAG